MQRNDANTLTGNNHQQNRKNPTELDPIPSFIIHINRQNVVNTNATKHNTVIRVIYVVTRSSNSLLLNLSEDEDDFASINVVVLV